MKIYCLVVVVAFICLKSFGQSDVANKSGFIITNAGDTVYGIIKNYPVHYLAREVLFKGENETDFNRYRPNEIKGYSFDSIQFKSYKSFDLICIDKKKELKIDTIITWCFIRKVVEGDLIFYVFNESFKDTRFFVKTREGNFTELKREIKYESSKKITNDKFKFELGKLMNNSPEMTKQILQTGFYEKSIAGTIDKYNRIKGESIKTLYTHKTKVDYSINFQGDRYPEQYKNPTWGYGVGVESHLYKPTKSLDTELSCGIYYNTFSYKGREIYGSPSPTYTYSARFFHLPVYVSYNNKVKVFSPICELGINPFWVKEKEIHPDKIYENKWHYHFDIMGNLGFSINIKQNISIKYLFHLNPLLVNSLKVSFRFTR